MTEGSTKQRAATSSQQGVGGNGAEVPLADHLGDEAPAVVPAKCDAHWMLVLLPRWSLSIRGDVCLGKRVNLPRRRANKSKDRAS